jgi:hypothetical protein
MVSQKVERAAELQDPEVRAGLDWHVRECERECSAGGRLGSFPQACARARQQATRDRLRARGAGAERERRTGAVPRRGGLAGNCACMPEVFLQCMCVSRGSSTREQEDPEVREGVSIANQSGPIGFSHKSTTSSSSYSSSIARARPQHLEEAPGPPIEPLRSLYAGTSLPW